jgi:predicted  nucleic acid-binding Zn-ribbon protein
MNAHLEALLDLQIIDKRRLALKRAREGQTVKVSDTENAAKAAESAAATATAEAEKMGALIRQYQEDTARCDTTIAELRSQQMNAKTNKEYMAIINGIEAAKLEKTQRDQSIKELNEKIAASQNKAKAASEQAATLRAKAEEVRTANKLASEPSDEEKTLQKRYDDIRAKIDPAFVETYERLIKANHKMPLMRIDPKTRSTVYGSIISHNVMEQIRMGKLTIDTGTNAILFIDEGSQKKAEN